ncbi:MAG TPA: DCC1-like thiol-disulfide oxidoreductase family protein, partial [Verrucomicrobiae bacterium]|nr:DCC1-like thiol-disulfide oxidoreductase family protein [Verrucomicrobiae bacterium]
MNTEITEKGWVLYDGDCHICTGTVRRWGKALARRGFNCVPLQATWVRERLNLSENELMREMRVLDARGNVIGGAAALLMLARHFWWTLPFVWLAKVPVIFRFIDAVYRWGAARRYCANGACKISRWRCHWLVLLLPVAGLFLAWDFPPWLFMWIMAGALWFALKVFTFLDVTGRTARRSLAYFLWPGTDAREFFSNDKSPQPPSRNWISAAASIGIGVILVYRIARLCPPLLAGWVGMIGIVLVLHFGIFKLLALLWRNLGIPAIPIMDAPLRSRSLSEFWGRRWNTGFSIPARRHLMEPIARKLGTRAGLLAVFLVSGLVHESVI